MTDHNKPAWDELLWGVRTGDPPFEHTHNGMSEFEWLRANPAEEDKFSKAMKEVDSLGEACTPLSLSMLRWHGWRGEICLHSLQTPCPHALPAFSCRTACPHADSYVSMAGSALQ